MESEPLTPEELAEEFADEEAYFAERDRLASLPWVVVSGPCEPAMGADAVDAGFAHVFPSFEAAVEFVHDSWPGIFAEEESGCWLHPLDDGVRGGFFLNVESGNGLEVRVLPLG